MPDEICYWCRGCGKKVPNRRDLSKRGLCRSCGPAKVSNAIEQMATKDGPIYEKYRSSILAYAEKIGEE